MVHSLTQHIYIFYSAKFVKQVLQCGERVYI